jgi:hypothetical protein
MTRLTKGTLLVAAIMLSAGMPTRAQIVNGSFEDVPTNLDPIPGWKRVVQPGCSIAAWGIAKTGDTLLSGSRTLNPVSGYLVPDGCTYPSTLPPMTFTATDRTQLAYHFIMGGGAYVSRMYQDITLPSAPLSTLYWDMRYKNYATVFAPNHYVAVRIRDSVSDVILETLFITDSSKPQLNPEYPLLHRDHSANLAAYSGKTVRLSVETQVINYLDAQFDNFRLVANAPVVPVPPVPPVGQDGELGQHGELGSTDRK